MSIRPHFCPDCKVERTDYEGPDNGWLVTCPNCGSAASPEGNDDQRRRMEMPIEEGRSVIITIADGKVVASVDASDRASQP